MSQQPSSPLDVRGAVDLTSFGRPTTPPPGEPGGAPAAGGYVLDATTETFNAVVELSAKVPVVVLMWLPTDEAVARFGASLGALIDRYEGRLVLARADVEAHPQVAAAFQVQGVPAVVALIAGQPVPLFQGILDDEQITGVLDQVLAAAEANGVTGRFDAEGAPTDDAPAEPEDEPLPPLHQKAYDAIGAGDLEGAIAAYSQALREDPRDAHASAGLANVRLLARTATMDLAAVRTAAAERPADLQAQLDVADLDLAGGKVEDALVRLVELLGSLDAEGKEAVRTRLVEYFDILGPQDPRVGPARRALANALY